MLVGICGKKGSGKDTVASLLSTLLLERGLIKATPGQRQEVVVRSFADPLKQGLSTLTGIKLSKFYCPTGKETVNPRFKVSPRVLMTDLYDHFREKYGYVPFVDLMDMAYTQAIADGVKAFIVPDVRFDDTEASWVRANGGVLIHVFRKSADEAAKKGAVHVSESGVPVAPVDIVLDNNHTMLHLHQQLSACIDGGMLGV